MEQQKALIIDDDPQVVESISDILVSRGHDYEVARCQMEACKTLVGSDYTYVILALAIPTRPKRCKSRLKNGIYILEEIVGSAHPVPVIVLVGTGCDGTISAAEMVDAAATAMAKGAAHVVFKPIPPSGWTLDRAIDKAIGKDEVSYPPKQMRGRRKPKDLVPFQGGEMTFYPDRVELCGVKILGDTGSGQSRAILELLDRTTPKGRWACMSGAKLAAKIGAPGGINTVTGCVRWLRGSIAQRLAEELGVLFNQNDVIVNDRRHGYCLAEWITTRHVTAEETGSSGSGHAKTGAPHEADTDRGELVEADTDPISARRHRVLTVLGEDGHLRAPDIAKRLNVSLPTAKRDLATLKREGIVAFEGSARNGHYRVVGLSEAP